MLRQVTCSLSPAHPSFRCLSLHEPLIFHHRFFQKEKSQSQKNYDSLKKNAPKADFDCKALLSAERLLEILTRAATIYPGRARLCACVLCACFVNSRASKFGHVFTHVLVNFVFTSFSCCCDQFQHQPQQYTASSLAYTA